MTDALPLVLLTGALGSGKTTILRELLRDPRMADTALVINEFGEVGLDHLLVSSAVETTLLLDNGCVCCSLRGDLPDTLADLLRRRDAGEIPGFGRIVVETSGVADPAPILRDLAGALNLAGRVRLAAVATVVDGALGWRPEDGDEAAANQVLQADLLIVSKCDLADPLRLDLLCERLASANPAARILRATGGAVDPAALFAPVFPRAAGAMERSGAHRLEGEHDHGHSHAHGGMHAGGHGGTHGGGHGGVESWSIVLDRPLPWTIFRAWFDHLYSLRAAQIVRMKGILRVTERERPVLAQAVGPVVSPPVLLDAWPGGEPATRLVVIARGLSAAAIGQSFQTVALARAGAPGAGPGAEDAA